MEPGQINVCKIDMNLINLSIWKQANKQTKQQQQHYKLMSITGYSTKTNKRNKNVSS